jgi:hypothetical protein
VGVFMTTSMAAILAITAGAYVVLRDQSQGQNADPVAAAAADLPVSHAGVALEAARQHMIRLDAAAKTLTIVSRPKVAAAPVPAAAATEVAGGGTGGTGTAGTAPPVSAPPPDPGTAQSIAYSLLPSYGFSASGQFGCLNDIWVRESGWRYNAENASGAYGIPQALPGDKMASAGPNWETDPTTQIKWGIGYIKDVYGSPCQAWAFWQDHGWY